MASLAIVFFFAGRYDYPSVEEGRRRPGWQEKVGGPIATDARQGPFLQPVLTRVRRHLAQRVLCSLRFPCQTATFCKFGRNARRVARFEKLRLWPKVVVFPQFSHFAIAIAFHFRIIWADRTNSTTAVGSGQDVL